MKKKRKKDSHNAHAALTSRNFIFFQFLPFTNSSLIFSSNFIIYVFFSGLHYIEHFYVGLNLREDNEMSEIDQSIDE